jgi:hypothetical protein
MNELKNNNIALILPTNLYFAPYLNIYTKILRQNEIKYDIIFWDREGLNENGGICFKKKSSKTLNKFKKIIDYYSFSKFVKKTVTINKYNKLVIFGPQIGLYLFIFLKTKFHKSFILDYRDLSIDQKVPYLFNYLLKSAFSICISSPGFKKVLPSDKNYILSHNFDIDVVKTALKNKIESNFNFESTRAFNISTIGGIRDYEQNEELIDSLRNSNKFKLAFIGKGISELDLKKYCNLQKIKNVSFLGIYKKKNEFKFYEEADFVSIYYPHIMSHSNALSNRFYNCLIYKVPMIVSCNSIQANYVEKYSLGLSIENCNNLEDKLLQYMNILKNNIFIDNCNKLLKEFIQDYNEFEINLNKFLEIKK